MAWYLVSYGLNAADVVTPAVGIETLGICNYPAAPQLGQETRSWKVGSPAMQHNSDSVCRHCWSMGRKFAVGPWLITVGQRYIIDSGKNWSVIHGVNRVLHSAWADSLPSSPTLPSKYSNRGYKYPGYRSHQCAEIHVIVLGSLAKAFVLQFCDLRKGSCRVCLCSK